MKQQPPFVANLHGACVPYAVANALHFVESPETGENLAERMLSFYPAIADGYLIGEIDGMMKIVDPDGELLANILHYNTTININKKQFFRLAQLWELSERIKEMDKATEYFVTFILFIYVDGVAHAVSLYISLDNFTAVLMDSKGNGKVQVLELEQLFSLFDVYGVVQVGVEMEAIHPETKEKEFIRIPYIIERQTIKLWK